VRTILAVLAAAAILAPAGIAVSQHEDKVTLRTRVAKLERQMRENYRRDLIVQNAVYLKETGVLPMLLETRLYAQSLERRIENVEACVQWRSVTLPGQNRPDRVAMVHPTCFVFKGVPSVDGEKQ
jgi:BMFP domain-containing protein YqiC